MITTDDVAKLRNSITDGYLSFLRIAGIASFAFGIIHLGLTVPALLIPESILSGWLGAENILLRHTEGGLLWIILYTIVGSVCFHIQSVLIHPSRFGPVLRYVEPTPDTDVYTDSPIAFVVVHILKPLVAFITLLVLLPLLYPDVFDVPILALG